MTDWTYDFDAGTADATATSSDYTEWGQVNGTLTYRAQGRISTNVLEYDTSGLNNVRIDLPSDYGLLYCQIYFRRTTTAADRVWLGQFYGTGNTDLVAQLDNHYDTGTHYIRSRDDQVAAGTSTTAIAEDTWYRLDWTLNRAAGTQTLTLHAGANLDSATITETIVDGSAGTLNDSANATIDTLRLGNTLSETAGNTIQLDRVIISDTAMPTPFSSSTDHTATPGDALGMTDIAAAAKTTVWPVTREIQIG